MEWQIDRDVVECGHCHFRISGLVLRTIGPREIEGVIKDARRAHGEPAEDDMIPPAPPLKRAIEPSEPSAWDGLDEWEQHIAQLWHDAPVISNEARLAYIQEHWKTDVFSDHEFEELLDIFHGNVPEPPKPPGTPGKAERIEAARSEFAKALDITASLEEACRDLRKMSRMPLPPIDAMDRVLAEKYTPHLYEEMDKPTPGLKAAIDAFLGKDDVA